MTLPSSFAFYHHLWDCSWGTFVSFLCVSFRNGGGGHCDGVYRRGLHHYLGDPE